MVLQETLDHGDCLLLSRDNHCSPKSIFLQTIFPVNLHHLSPNLLHPTKKKKKKRRIIYENTLQFPHHTCLVPKKLSQKKEKKKKKNLEKNRERDLKNQILGS